MLNQNLIKADIINHLFHGKGYLILNDIAMSERELTLFANDLGQPMIEYRNLGHHIIYNVQKRDLGQANSMADTNLFFELHTDCSNYENPPNTVLLYCIRQAKEGGETLLYNLKNCITQFHDENIEYLSKTVFNFGMKKDESILNFKNNILSGVRYSRILIDRFTGNANHDILNGFEQILAANAEIVKLLPGQMLLLNNKTLLHGRKAFESNGDRLLKRIRLDILNQS